MTRKQFEEVKGTTLEMKENGQTKILASTPLVVVGPTKGVVVLGPST